MNRKTTLEVQLLPCKQHQHRVYSIKLGRFPIDSVIRYKPDHVEVKSFMTGKKSFHYKIKTYKWEDLAV